MEKNILKELKKRKLIIQITNKKQIFEELNKNKINIYCGFDPTSDSLHLGHLIPLISLKRFIKYGYKINILIGQTTSLIGDPSFKNKKRKNQKTKNILLYTKKIKKQIYLFFSKHKKKINLFNNNDWFNKIKIIFLLKKIGQYFSINQMLNKESIKIRNKNKEGITFSELSYNILQSYDFAYLFKKYNINLQIGGSDQWGNITSGINLINKIYKQKAFGITLPLMITKNGNKLGKTENKTLWLNKKKTTPYKFYQFWLNIPDEQTYTFLKQLTFIKLKQIKKIKNKKNIILAKKILAKKITKIVHGKKELKNVILISKIIFTFLKKNIIKEKFLFFLFRQKIPKIKIKKTTNIKKILILLKIVKSKNQAKNLILNNSISLNNKKITDINYTIKKKDKIFNKFTFIYKGKKSFYLIKWI